MQEEQRNPHRWLLPLTRELDLPAIEVVLCLAAAGKATLIVVSLVAAPRVPHMRDLPLDILRTRARQFAVALECYDEYVTSAASERICAMTRELSCDGLLLGSADGQALFLTDDELRTLLMCPPTSLVLVRLPQSTIPQPRSAYRTRRRAYLPWRASFTRQAEGLRTNVSPPKSTETLHAESNTRAK